MFSDVLLCDEIWNQGREIKYGIIICIWLCLHVPLQSLEALAYLDFNEKNKNMLEIPSDFTPMETKIWVFKYIIYVLCILEIRNKF